MIITTKIVWDMATWEVLYHDFYEYSGTVALAKGDGIAQQQLTDQNALTKQQLALQNATQKQVSDAVGGDLSGTNGFSPTLYSALVSQFLNQNTGSFQSAASNVHAALASQGEGTGALPVGGNYAGNIASLEAAKASSQSQGLLGLGIQNLQQGLTNKYNAASVLQGNSAQLGNSVGTFNSGANNALNTYVQAANTGFGNAFSTAFGGALGKGLGSFTSGSIASGISGKG